MCSLIKCREQGWDKGSRAIMVFFFFFFLAFLSETIYSWHVQSTTLVDVLAGLSGRTREEAWAFAYAILSRLVGLGFPRSRSLSTVLESQPRGHTLRFRNPFTS